MSTPIPIFDPEDPQLTAYALGELTDPAERAEVEQLLQHSPEARLAMKEIQDITNTLTAEYDQERRTAGTPAATDPPPPNVIDLSDRRPDRRRTWVRPFLAIAAVLLLAGISMPVFNSVPPPNHGKRFAGAKQATMHKVQPRASTTVDRSPGSDVSKGNSDEHVNLPASPVTELLPPAQELALNGQTAAAPPAVTGPVAAAPLLASNGKKVETFDLKPGLATALPMNQPTGSIALPPPVEPIMSMAKREPVPQFGVVGGVVSGSGAGTGPGGRGRDYNFNVGLAGKPVAPAESSSALFAAPAAAAPSAQPARVSRSTTEFYRTESGLRAKGTVGPLVRNEALKDQSEVRFGVADKAKIQDQRDSDAAAGVDSLVTKNTVNGRAVLAKPEFNTAAYDHLVENAFLTAKENPLSTFSIDVDTASYANVRRFLDAGSLPPPDAVRLEELINYFPYDYAPPAADSDKPFAVHLESAACPWAPEHRLVRVGIKGKEIAQDKRPASNLVFLLDVSGSMEPPERLPLIRRAMSMLVEHLTENDRVAIVTYAGNSGLVLPSTRGDKKDTILNALDRLQAGGSTNGASGITLAYQVAKEGFIKGGTNRVILATDGDFNVGVTSQGDLIRLIQNEAKTGVFLSALGVGTDNYKDSTMQKLADKGNGNYNYIDRIEEARKVLVEQMSGTLLTIAKDVKIQVEFNPAAVSSYRLIGYEKRMLRKEDFNDDRIDAGEIGAGHSVTALYEVVPFGQPTPEAAPAVDALKYGDQPKAVRATTEPVEAPKDKTVDAGRAVASPEMLTVKMRHKAPDADKSERTYEVPMYDNAQPGDFAKASPDFKFAAAVATFGLSLRDSPYKGGATLGAAVEMAQEGKGTDSKGYRQEFIDLVRRAQTLKDAR